jgi:hypothetical protein
MAWVQGRNSCIGAVVHSSQKQQACVFGLYHLLHVNLFEKINYAAVHYALKRLCLLQLVQF